MSIQLTPEQERIATPNAELESLLLEGLAAAELCEEEFWKSVDRETSAMQRASAERP